MSAPSTSGIVRRKSWGQSVQRLILFAVLGLFCLYYLTPLVVMVATSLKSLAEIRTSSLSTAGPPDHQGRDACRARCLSRPQA